MYIEQQQWCNWRLEIFSTIPHQMNDASCKYVYKQCVNNIKILKCNLITYVAPDQFASSDVCLSGCCQGISLIAMGFPRYGAGRACADMCSGSCF